MSHASQSSRSLTSTSSGAAGAKKNIVAPGEKMCYYIKVNRWNRIQVC